MTLIFLIRYFCVVGGGSDLEWDELETQRGQYVLAHNGWVMDADPLVNFAAEGTKVETILIHMHKKLSPPPSPVSLPLLSLPPSSLPPSLPPLSLPTLSLSPSLLSPSLPPLYRFTFNVSSSPGQTPLSCVMVSLLLTPPGSGTT